MDPEVKNDVPKQICLKGKIFVTYNEIVSVCKNEPKKDDIGWKILFPEDEYAIIFKSKEESYSKKDKLWYEFHIYAKNNDNANKIAKDFFHITADIEHTKEIPNVSVNNEMELLQKNMKKLIEENETLSNRNIFLNKKVDVLENLNKTYKEKLDEQNKDKKFFSE